MRVLGLDLSLRGTGICFLTGEPGSKPSIETKRLARESCSGVAAGVHRLLSISDEIINMIGNSHIDAVIIEAPAQNQKWQAAAIGELHGAVKTQLFLKLNIIPMVEQATKVRKSVVGKIVSKRVKQKKDGKIVSYTTYGTVPSKIKGKTKKASVKDIIEMRLKNEGLSFDTQDEMDAYVTARYAWDALQLGEK